MRALARIGNNTTTAAREPLAGSTFFVEDMERRQADIGNFLLAELIP
jgi:hypothetical protein